MKKILYKSTPYYLITSSKIAEGIKNNSLYVSSTDKNWVQKKFTETVIQSIKTDGVNHREGITFENLNGTPLLSLLLHHSSANSPQILHKTTRRTHEDIKAGQHEEHTVYHSGISNKSPLYTFQTSSINLLPTTIKAHNFSGNGYVSGKTIPQPGGKSNLRSVQNRPTSIMADDKPDKNRHSTKTQKISSKEEIPEMNLDNIEFVQLHPDPESDNLIIELKNEKFVSFTIFDINGKSVYRGIIKKYIKIKISDFMSLPGMYLLITSCGNTTHLKKFVLNPVNYVEG